MSTFVDETLHQPSCFVQFCNHGAGSTIHNRPAVAQSRIHHDHHSPIAADEKDKHQELDALLSQAMNALTFEERQKQQEIVHGVDQTVEDAAFTDFALQELDHHLSCIKEGSTYEMAERMDPKYVHDRAFRVMFLRANEYNSKESAEQMLRWFDLKHELFGENKLTKEIALEDLSDNDIASLKRGGLQMAGRDRSGRQVFITVGGLVGSTEFLTIQNQLRATFYTLMKALKSEETQIRGTVGIWFAMGDFRNKTKKGKGEVELFKAESAIPRKRSVVHICVDDMHQALLCNALLRIMNHNFRARVKVHYGSQTEVQYTLSTYGILPHSWPVDHNGKMKFARHMQWIDHCAMEDKLLSHSASAPAKPLVRQNDDTPGPNDVLFTGSKVRNHAGSLAFRDMVKEHFQEYESGTDEIKRQLADKLIERVHESGGRFLRQTKVFNRPIWEEVPGDEIRSLVMQRFRNRRRLDNVASKQQVSHHSPKAGTLIADSPVPNDVIFSRASIRNPGTELFHRLIRNHFQEYESLDRGVKMRFVETAVMQVVMAQGGRFLQPSTEEPGRWLELSYDSARERISKSFRNHRRYSKSMQPL